MVRFRESTRKRSLFPGAYRSPSAEKKWNTVFKVSTWFPSWKFHFKTRHARLWHLPLSIVLPFIHWWNDLTRKDKDKNEPLIASFLCVGKEFLKQDGKSANLKGKNNKLICVKINRCFSKDTIRRVKNHATDWDKTLLAILYRPRTCVRIVKSYTLCDFCWVSFQSLSYT